MTCNEQETYNKKETTYSDLKQARNNLKGLTMSNKQPRTTYNEQEMP